MANDRGQRGVLSEFSQLEIALGLGVLALIGGAIGTAVIFGISALLDERVALASNYAAFASGLATILLVIVTTWYVGLVRKQTQAMHRQALVMQESEWVPEIFFNATAEEMQIRGKRAWFPEFKAEVQGEDTEWIENDFVPVPEEKQMLGVEWITTIPEEIGTFLSSLEQGEHTGKLHFKFQSFTGESYRLIYTIEFTVDETGYEINRYPSMERELPWESQ